LNMQLLFPMNDYCLLWMTIFLGTVFNRRYQLLACMITMSVAKLSLC
jgi:hypothetical protein